MQDDTWVQLIQQHRAIAVIRSPEFELGWQMANAIASGGIRLIEITWNSNQPTKLINELRSQLPHCQIGAGTLLNSEQMQEAVAAGAQFLFTPHTDPKLIDQAVRQAIPIIPGALSPTEIVLAWQSGATCVKVFPIETMGGATYIKSLQGPLGQIPLIPTGGVTIDNAATLLQAGAIAVGLSSSLFPKSALKVKDWQKITQQAQILMAQLTKLDLKQSFFSKNLEQSEI
jgi:2-dehydro-3-deoxyphosphogluconate aldolase / (4S)-4-hydroxy-2-oxoglutarate aldolase